MSHGHGVVIPARNEAVYIADTVAAALRLADVDLVVVVCDGCTDDTAAKARAHGAVVVGLARRCVEALAGWSPRQPLSGQRCITREMFDRVRPLAHGFGVETGLSTDVRRAGGRIAELDLPLSHRVTGNDARSQLHRARQFVDIARAGLVRELPRPARDGVRMLRQRLHAASAQTAS